MGCVLQPTRRGRWAPHGLCVSRGGGVKTCSTLPWPSSGWSLQFVCAVLTRRSLIEVSGCQGGDPAGGAERALTQERAAITVRGLPRTAHRSGQSQARGAAPERRPTPEAAETRLGPWGAGHRCPAAHSPAVKDHLTYLGAQRQRGGVGARCHHTVHLPPPAPRPARACAACPPARPGPATTVRQHRGLEA